MERCNFDLNKSVTFYIPYTYIVEILSGNDIKTFDGKRVQNERYVFGDWSIGILNDADCFLCIVKKQFNSDVNSEIRLHIKGNDTKGRNASKFMYFQQNSIYDSPETIKFNMPVVKVYLTSNGLLEWSCERSEVIEVVSEDSGENEASNKNNQTNMERVNICLALNEEIKKMKKELDDLDVEIQRLKDEKSSIEKAIAEKREEEKKIIARLEATRLSKEDIVSRYEEKADELKAYMEDTKYAVESRQAAMCEEAEELMNEIEQKLKKLDALLIRTIKSSEEESKRIAAAIFHEGGKM